ncbi:MAG: hypothetical protein LBV80_07905 [Deltaproteobacteria bacterium]|jgi:hypothetical protein|nr:hypothetical protein [Deltaproteobacteria bacterium]
MKIIAVYYDGVMSKAVAEQVSELAGEAAGSIQHRAARYFHPGQKEKFDLAVVDGKAKNAAEIIAGLEKWGVEVISGPTEKAPDGGKPLDKMNKTELEAVAAGMGLEFPADATNNQKRVEFLTTELEKLEKAPDGGNV